MTVVHLVRTQRQGFEIRALEPDDVAELVALFGRLSAESRYLRYLTAVRELSPDMLDRLSSVDHDRHEAVGAFADGALVGAAHWFRSGSERETAEVAVEVADRYQRCGLGGVLMAELGRRAAARGIRRFTALAWGDNHGVLALVRRGTWPAVLRSEGAELQIELALPA